MQVYRREWLGAGANLYKFLTALELCYVPGSRLANVSLIEVDQNGDFIWDYGVISLIGPGGINIELRRGPMADGRLGWNGDIPLNGDMSLYVNWSIPPVNARCIVAWTIALKDDVTGTAPNPISVQQIYPVGIPLVISIASAAAGVALALRPPEKRAWAIVEAWGYHDDNGGPHTLNWNYTDGVTTISKTGISVAINIQISLLTSTPYLSQGNALHLQYTKLWSNLISDGMGAGKKLYINAVVQEYTYLG